MATISWEMAWASTSLARRLISRRDVEQGRLAATVLLPSCAGPAIELALRWKRDGALPPRETVLAPAPYPAL